MAELAEKAKDVVTGALSGSTSESAKVYVDEAAGSDESGTGTEDTPFKTAIRAFDARGSDISVFVRKASTPSTAATASADAVPSPAPYQPISDSARKKALKIHEGNQRKLAKRVEQEKAEEKRLEALKEIKLDDITEEEKGKKIKLRETVAWRGKGNVRVLGWVHRVRQQKALMFVDLRDGTGYLQCVFSGNAAKTYDAVTLTVESTVEIVGTIQELPAGHTAVDNHELSVVWWRVIGRAPGGDEAFTNLISADLDPGKAADIRHLSLRGDISSAVLKVRSKTLSMFRKNYERLGLAEVTPPCIVQTMVEGGATLFGFDYYGKKAYLTQSSQLYLETCLPSLGDVFCVQESFRAENSHTRRHLSEFTHLEGELAFINFSELMDHIEEIICSTLQDLLADAPTAALIKMLNEEENCRVRAAEGTGYVVSEEFRMPERPFMRMDYKDAIQWLREKGIKKVEKKDDGTIVEEEHEIGDDIAEAAERRMTDAIGKPIFLTGFPAGIKAFYAKKAEDREYTEAVDLLIPGVGEVVGGSMRIDDHEELVAAFKHEGLDLADYYWYLDQRKYGTQSHGGYGLGVERLVAWITRRYTVRSCSLYPRWTGRATP